METLEQFKAQACNEKLSHEETKANSQEEEKLSSSQDNLPEEISKKQQNRQKRKEEKKLKKLNKPEKPQMQEKEPKKEKAKKHSKGESNEDGEANHHHEKDSKVEIEKLRFAKIGKSEMTLWHRPKLEDIHVLMEKQKVSVILSLLNEKTERPYTIQETCEKVGIKWFYVSIAGAREVLLKDKQHIENFKTVLIDLYELLSTTHQRVLVHCAAGFHRTGVAGYLLMRMDGLNELDAYESLKIMREITYQEVKEWRIELAEKMIFTAIQSEIDKKKQTEIKQIDQQEEENKYEEV